MDFEKNRAIHDYLSTSRAKRILRSRGDLVAHIRGLLRDMGFFEVDTPVLYRYPEIAPMEQFEVIDPTSNRSYFMRVAPTGHLKRMMTAGFDKVYEFSRNFRPGNSSFKHSAEFTSLECGQLSADYNVMMELTETIVFEGVRRIMGGTIVDVAGRKFDVRPPWRRKTVREALQAYSRIG